MLSIASVLVPAPTMIPLVQANGGEIEATRKPTDAPDMAAPVSSDDLPSVSSTTPPSKEGNVGLNPRATDLLDFDQVDTDVSGKICYKELSKHVNDFKFATDFIIKKARDPIARRFLLNQSSFHYEQLNMCVHRGVEKMTSETAINEAQYKALRAWVKENCAIQFRTTLLAGPPVYEQIERRSGKVSPEKLKKWFKTEWKKTVALAKHFESQGVKIEANLSRTHECSLKAIAQAPAEISRDQFYDSLSEIQKCIKNE